MVRSYFTHDNWLEDQADKGVPLYADCYVDDLRTIELGYWDVRGCDTAFIRFTNMGGVTEARVQEIPAGQSLPAFKLGVDELVYVVQGRGFASVYGDISKPHRDFEWSERAAFVIPRNAWCELRNMSDQPVRLLHFNYLLFGEKSWFYLGWLLFYQYGSRSFCIFLRQMNPYKGLTNYLINPLNKMVSKGVFTE